MPTYFLKTQFLLFVLTSFLLLNSGCKKNTTEPVETLALTVEDVSCTEAWVKVTTTNYQTPNTLTLFVNDKAEQSITLVSNDTLLYVDSLLPNQSYKIKAAFANNNQLQTTNEVIAKTMDTTSHNFTWQTFNFGGDGGSSFLSDISIINENNIWAVGEILIADTSINGYTTYNAVHWDGSEWELLRIPYYYNGQAYYNGIRAIFTFNDNDIWFGTGNMTHWNGTQFVSIYVGMGMSINKIWGSSSSDLYVVGNGGNIAHYNGSGWTKIESGTTVDLRDITGNGSEIWISGYSLDNSKSILLKLLNSNIIKVWENYEISGTPPYGNLIYSVCCLANNLFIASNEGIFKDKLTIKYPTQELFMVPRCVYKITGTNINNIFTAGDRSNIWHYNGISAKEIYVNLFVPSPLYSAAAKDKI